MQLSRFDVDTFLREAIEHVSVAAERAPVEIDVSPRGLHAVADPARLRQVVINLVDNAIRHSPAGGRVWLQARREGSGLRLEVADDGPGIAAGERERVFQRFTRGATSDGGTGLGLAIARWAVELHSGSIEVMDNGMGCRIRVDIPDMREES